MTEPSRASLALGLALATLAVYAQTVGFEFVSYDDPLYVTANPHVLEGLTREGVVWAFSDPSYNWYPLTWLSHMLDVEWFGLWAGGHHAVGVLLHLTNTLLLFWVLGSATRAYGRSAFVAALFALHPLHVETVAWVSGRKDLLSTCLGLLAAAAYVSYTRERQQRTRWALYAATSALFALSLMAKSMLVTLPFVFLLLDYWPLGRSGAARLVLEKLPLLALSVAASWLAVVTQSGGGAMVDAAGIAFEERLANTVFSYAAYVADTVWPSGLSILRPHPYLASTGGTPLTAVELGGAVVVLAAISGAVMASGRRYAHVGWLWYLGTLVPVIGLVQIGVAGRADRYTYWPLVGLFLAVTWGGFELWTRSGWGSEGSGRRALGAVATLLVVVCGLLSVQQSRHWRAAVPLFERVVDAHPSALAHVGLGRLHATKGDWAAAEASYRSALALDPQSTEAHNNLAGALLRRGAADEGLAQFRATVRLAPDRIESVVNLAGALAAVGRTDESIEQLRNALRIDPSSVEAHYNLGNALLASGDVSQAIDHFREALRVRPDFARAHFNLGYALSSEGDLDGAIDHYRRALQLEPDYERARVALQQTLAHRAAGG